MKFVIRLHEKKNREILPSIKKREILPADQKRKKREMCQP